MKPLTRRSWLMMPALDSGSAAQTTTGICSLNGIGSATIGHPSSLAASGDVPHAERQSPRTLPARPFRPLNVRSTEAVPGSESARWDPIGRPRASPKGPCRGRIGCRYTPAVGASVTLTAPSVAVEPGGEATLDRPRPEHRDRSSTSSPSASSATPAGWATVDPPTISLFPGAEENARIVFRPPRGPAVPAGAMPFGLHARVAEDPAGSTVEEGTVEVGAVPRAVRRARPADVARQPLRQPRSRGRQPRQHPAQRRARGRRRRPPARVRRQSAGRRRRAGHGRRSRRSRSSRRSASGAARPRPGRSSSSSAPRAPPPITLDGALLQEAMLPPWFMRAVMALLASC